MQDLIQRAFELAPECSSLKELRQHLASEGCDRLDAHLGGLSIQRQLRSYFDHMEGQRPRGPQCTIEVLAE